MAKVCYRCHVVETLKWQGYCPECLSIRRKGKPVKYRTERLTMQVRQSHIRARHFGVESTLTLDDWRAIIEAAGRRCVYCQKSIDLTTVVIDHAVPMSQGGANTPENIRPTCYRCNSRKAQRAGAEPPPITVTRLGDDEVVITYSRSMRIRMLLSEVPDLLAKLSEITP